MRLDQWKNIVDVHNKSLSVQNNSNTIPIVGRNFHKMIKSSQCAYSIVLNKDIYIVKVYSACTYIFINTIKCFLHEEKITIISHFCVIINSARYREESLHFS